MANKLYAKGAEKILDALIDLPTATIKAALVSSAYVPNLTTHEFYTDISANVLGTPQTLAGKTITGGVFDADDVTYTAVAAGSTATYVALYLDSGSPSTSPLIALLDTIAGFPMSTNGGNVLVQWDAGAYKIFSLV